MQLAQASPQGDTERNVEKMRYCSLLSVLVALAVAGAGCDQSKAPKKVAAGAHAQPSTPPAQPSTLPASAQGPAKPNAASGPSEEKLLLLDEGPQVEAPGHPQAPGRPMADNSRCHVCHLNYAQEELAVKHARADVGCAKCHGPSDAHIADESWTSGGNGTAPDTMFPRSKINTFCMGCHAADKIDADKHKAFLAGKSEKKYCTDCHGKHRLAKRNCRWK